MAASQPDNGFNEPTLKQMTHKDNTAEAARINGEAYTQLLREARDLLHSHGREIGVHVHALMFQPDNRHGGPWGPVPMNIQWQWEQWIKEIADYVEFRGANMLLPPNIRVVADRIGLAAREAGIPFIYQSTRGRTVHFDGPHKWLAKEVAWARRHPDITFYNLYETAEHYTRMGKHGRLEGSPDVADLIRRRWWQSEVAGQD